jgi:hypothetical protein
MPGNGFQIAPQIRYQRYGANKLPLKIGLAH